MASLTETRHELAIANRILFSQGVVDGFGHVSVRHPTGPDRFLLARSMAPALVTADDILTFDLNGEAADAAGRAVYLERFIHSEIYRRRPDVISVVHNHSPAVVPFGVVRGATLRPICHMSGFLGDGAPVFEIRDTAGEASDMLICSRQLGAALAASLGQSAVVLMRGHGCTVIGGTLRQAVFRAVYTEVNAKLQCEAVRLGPVTYLSAAEAHASSTTNDGQIDRAWQLWRMRAEAA
ncbi:MAG TPA: class II aldolase/adducin family protein [Acetobacteraceae bacterium]|jgi:ribulose-5-phosphate 4-epimerase/fuculose-1-phosphate aldolase|nr:class II aldolase/adducin family protein [Acetobacteraceae bacterium]